MALHHSESLPHPGRCRQGDKGIHYSTAVDQACSEATHSSHRCLERSDVAHVARWANPHLCNTTNKDCLHLLLLLLFLPTPTRRMTPTDLHRSASSPHSAGRGQGVSSASKLRFTMRQMLDRDDSDIGILTYSCSRGHMIQFRLLIYSLQPVTTA